MLKEGDKAPPFNLMSDDGTKVKLKNFAGKPVVLYFYPKDMTPGCTLQACDFRDSFSALQKKKVAVLGISRDPVEKHRAFKEKYNLPFTLLCDEDGKVCEAYGVWQEKSLYGRKFMGIVRSTFIVNGDGRIKKIYPKVKVKGHVTDILGSID